MHHAGTGTGEAAHLPQRGVPSDAGLLAERAPAEDGHQGHPQPPAGSGQEPAGLPRYPGLVGLRTNQGEEIRGWRVWGFDLRLKASSFNFILLIPFQPWCLGDSTNSLQPNLSASVSPQPGLTPCPVYCPVVLWKPVKCLPKCLILSEVGSA